MVQPRAWHPREGRKYWCVQDSKHCYGSKPGSLGGPQNMKRIDWGDQPTRVHRAYPKPQPGRVSPADCQQPNSSPRNTFTLTSGAQEASIRQGGKRQTQKQPYRLYQLNNANTTTLRSARHNQFQYLVRGTWRQNNQTHMREVSVFHALCDLAVFSVIVTHVSAAPTRGTSQHPQPNTRRRKPTQPICRRSVWAVALRSWTFGPRSTQYPGNEAVTVTRVLSEAKRKAMRESGKCVYMYIYIAIY